MTIDLTEVKAYLETNFSFENEEVLETTAENLKRVLENTLYGGIAYNDNIYSLYQKKKIEQLEENIEKTVENDSRGKVKDYSLTLNEDKDKKEFHLQGYIELKWKE